MFTDLLRIVEHLTGNTADDQPERQRQQGCSAPKYQKQRVPNVIRAAEQCIAAGAHGITSILV
jgi:hypothetical protein